MESEDDSRSSSNSSGSSNSSSNGPTSPPQQEHETESNDQPETANNEHQSRSSSPDSNSFQEKPENTNRSMSPVREQKISNEDNLKDDEEEELELSDIEEDSNKQKKTDISHEDLSDISDLESNSPTQNFTDLRQKLDKQRLNGSGAKDGQDKTNDEDELDFEADEVREVSENKKLTDVKDSVEKQPKEEGEAKSDDEVESGEELEDGEVTDGDDKRPEESEPKAVCRFFTRGQCTWGMSCRFLHPGTTDKGNYTMFDMVRPIPVPQAVPRIMPIAYDYRHDRPPIHHIPPHAPFDHPRIPPVADSESAWDRGVRTAKEMIRKAKKRKEQDIDFDEKKMNLSGPVDEIEKDPYYIRGSPEATPPYDKAPGRERSRYEYSPPPKYSRGAPGHFEEDPFGRVPRYRELPAHRMPHYEDDNLSKRGMVRSTREVIVEKADEWNDPWARKTARRGSAGRERTRGKERSYSSNSSYSTSSETSRSRSSSESSGSPSAPRRGRFDSHRSKERLSQRKQIIRAKSRSSSLKRRHSPPVRPRTIEKKLASPIPSLKRKRPISPPLRQERIRTSHSKKKHDSSSGSGSSSGSESDTSYSSSTSDSKGKKKREKIVVERKQAASKAEIIKKHVTPVKDDKKDKISEKAAAAAKMKSTRREELLKQLKAVEDAIARKKSKIN